MASFCLELHVYEHKWHEHASLTSAIRRAVAQVLTSLIARSCRASLNAALKRLGLARITETHYIMGLVVYSEKALAREGNISTPAAIVCIQDLRTAIV